jgi:hypothetical protein
VLNILHLPIALWLAVGVAYVGSRWFTSGRRMDFVRFSGELAMVRIGPKWSQSCLRQVRPGSSSSCSGSAGVDG